MNMKRLMPMWMMKDLQTTYLVVNPGVLCLCTILMGLPRAAPEAMSQDL